MEKINQGHPLSQSPDFVKENIELLKALFPTIVKEGKIVMEELEALLGEDVEKEEEYYNFTWAGKSLARREANKPSTATLRPDKSESKDWDNTSNIFIEGDNLEVLKLLQKSYANKVKMIYIDPPYNTGKDFVYKDNYADNLSNYLSITKQVDREGKRLSTNSESDGRYHSNWLNMMYPRLKLARNLLREDGVIFISIDDNELNNLKIICDEIFGSENFIEIFNWAKTETPANLAKKSKKVIEYILCYQKIKNDLKFNGVKKTSQSSNGLLNQSNKVSCLTFPANTVYTSIDNGVVTSGKYGTESYEVILLEDALVKDGLFISEVKLQAKFKWTQNNLDEEIKKGTIIKIPTIKLSPSYEKKEYAPEVPPNLINSKVGVGTNETAGTHLTKLMGSKVFDFPKPVSLLEYLLKFIEDKDGVYLDFFAGSGPLAEAVFNLNKEDDGDRKFICVQLPEPIKVNSNDTEDQKKAKENAFELLSGLNKPFLISEITKERIRRAGDKIISEISKDLFAKSETELDIGFRAFKLDSSNLKTWDGNPDKLEENLFTAGKNIKEDRTEEDVLFEILLKYGLDLTVPIEEKSVNGKMVYSVGYGTLFICLSDNITTEVADAIGQWKEELEPPTSRVIFKDSGFNDVQKTNSIQILKRFGITEVNTI